MDNLYIETFLKIVETRSLSKAAEALFIAQSTVSHRLKSLEIEVGFQLVIRRKGHKYIELTNKGEDFIGIAERYLSLNRDVEQLQNSIPKRTLSIGCVETLNSLVFQQLYGTMINELPNLLLDISSHWSYVIYDLLESHEIDLGLVLVQLHSRNVICEAIFRERMVIIYNSNLSSYPETIHPEDMDISKEVFLNWSPSYQSWHDYWFSFTKNYRIKVDSSSLILSFILSSDSWIIVPISLARAFQKLYPINISEISEPPPERVCYKIKHKFPNPNQDHTITEFENYLDKFVNSEELKALIN